MLYDAKYKGMSAEEVYDDLMKNCNKINLSELLKNVLDEHLDGEGDPDDGEGDGDQEGLGKGRPRLSEAERKAIRDEVKEAMLQSAQTCGAGNLPSGVRRLVKDLTEPKISWKELLEQQIQSTIKSDFTWARPSRRGWHMDAILPGMKPGETIDVAISIDQSGSISAKDSQIFLSEIKGIMDSYDEYNIRVWCFDTEIYNDQSFNSDTMADIMQYEPAGGGGTLFEANWDYMKEHGIEPKKFIMFTDGIPGRGWGDENYCDTVWIIKGNPDCEPPWGIWAHYEDEARK
jgi:predicted metal-dependent peptidase